MRYNNLTMGITKTDLFTEDQNQLAQLAKVLAHPARIAIIQEVIKSQSCVNHFLVQELGLAQATISQHLKELKSAGILCGSVEGKTISYCINAQSWEAIRKQFEQLFGQFSCSTTNNNNPSNACCS